MGERNILTAVIVLLLPLSFGIDPGPGLKTTVETGTNYISTMNIAPALHRDLPTAKRAARNSAIPIKAATAKRISGDTSTSESLFDMRATHDITCKASTTTNTLPEVGGANKDCCCTGKRVESADYSAIGFSPSESFRGSDSSEDNRAATVVIPIVHGGRSPDAPISTPEPGSLAMLACGLIALAGLMYKKSNRAAVHAEN